MMERSLLTELELILYWTLFIVSIVLTGVGIGTLVMARRRRGFSENKIVKVKETKQAAEVPALFSALEKLAPKDMQTTDEDKSKSLPPPPDPTCEECGSESKELKPLIMAVAGTATTRKMVCPNCLKRLTTRHVI